MGSSFFYLFPLPVFFSLLILHFFHSYHQNYVSLLNPVKLMTWVLILFCFFGNTRVALISFVTMKKHCVDPWSCTGHLSYRKYKHLK
jgi:predicted Na+-dependent transporter